MDEVNVDLDMLRATVVDRISSHVDCANIVTVDDMEYVRVLALAAQEGWRAHHMDVKSAFLNGDLKEEVYVQQPLGYTVAGEEGKVYRLRKALYGLLQALRAWNAKLDNTLKALGFQQSDHEAAMYRRGSGRTVLLVGVYVDDLIITGAAEDEVEAFKAQMKQIFDMSDLGTLTFYLGVEVHQDATGITLRQTHYAKRILELGGMDGSNPANTPMEERLRLSKNSTAALVDPTHYRPSSEACATWCTHALTWPTPSAM